MRTTEPGRPTVLLWCFNHEMRSALAFRERHPEWQVLIRNVRTIGPDDIEPADRVFASTYCYGRVLKVYDGVQGVEEVWLRPDYRHEVHATEDGYQLYEQVGVEWLPKGGPQLSEEEAWAVLDAKEMGL